VVAFNHNAEFSRLVLASIWTSLFPCSTVSPTLYPGPIKPPLTCTTLAGLTYLSSPGISGAADTVFRPSPKQNSHHASMDKVRDLRHPLMQSRHKSHCVIPGSQRIAQQTINLFIQLDPDAVKTSLNRIPYMVCKTTKKIKSQHRSPYRA
jgi:hypothetical protein